MSEFTAGKWEVEMVYGDHPIVTVERRIVADCFNNEANARLIAAAPEMYRLLQIFADEPSDEEEREERINELCLAMHEARVLLARIDSEGQEDK